jgi:hypothetical protein
MDVKRRDFLIGCAATSALVLAGVGSTASFAGNVPQSSADPDIAKAIKASFGGGFSVQAHTRSAGTTYADIEHFGNRYAVASSDLLDWQIIRTLPRVAPT